MTDSAPGASAAVSAPGAAGELLSLRGIVKRLPGVLALSGVDFDLRRGEIHALVGENGAGKSTLMKIIAGMIQPDEGTIQLDGRERRFEHLLEAQQAGFAFIHQELCLAPHLISQYMPAQYFGVRAGRIRPTARDLVIERICDVMELYLRAGAPPGPETALSDGVPAAAPADLGGAGC